MNSPFSFFITTLALVFVGASQNSFAVTVTYTMQTGNFNSRLTERNNNPPYAGTYNNGATELAQYANGGSFGNTPGAAAFQTFTTTGNGNTGTTRALQVGDTFTITGFVSSNPSAGGYIGISFRDSTTYSNFSSATDNTTEARFQLDNTGGWKVYNSGTAVDSGLGSNADRTFTIKITSANTFNATIGSTTYYDLSMAASGGTIDSFAIYTFGDSNQNSFWKSASLSDTGTVEFGNGATSGQTRTVSGVIANGLAANSTSSTINNAVTINGASGSQVNFTAANTYSGATTISANATLEAQNADALGTTAGTTTVNSGGVLKLYHLTGLTYAAEGLTLNGSGISDAGALINTGDANTWQGTITLGSGSRINSSSGTLTISGAINLSSNTLYLGGSGGITIGNSFSNAAKNTGDGAIFWDGSGTLRLNTATQSALTGNIALRSGTVLIGADNALGTGAVTVGAVSAVTLASADNTARPIANNITMSTSDRLNLGQSTGGTGNLTLGGTLAFGATGANHFLNVANSGTTVTINGIVSGASKNLIKEGAGTLVLSANNSYSGGTFIDAGTLVFSAGTSGTSGIDIGTTAGATASAATLRLSGVNYTLTENVLINTGGNRTIDFANSTGTTALNGSVTANKDFEVAVGTSGATGEIQGAVTGAFVLTKTGAGTLRLSSDTSSFGALTVSAGSVNINGNTTVTGLSGSSGSISISSGKALTVNTGSQSTFGLAISGSGGLTKTGSSTLSLSGNNSFDGTTTVSNGTMAVTANNALGSVNGGTTVASGASLDFQNINYSTAEAVTLNGGTIAASTGTSIVAGGITLGAASIYNIGGTQLTQSGVITDGAGSFGITKSGSGTLVLSADNTYDGGTTINAGTVSIGKDLALGNAPGSAAAANITFNGGTLSTTTGFTLNTNRGITMTGAGTVSVANTTTLAYGGVITGSGTLTKTGAGTLSLGGVATHSGNFDITEGTVALTGSGSLASSARINIGSGDKLDISGLSGDTSVKILSEVGNGNGGNVKLGARTLTMDGGAANTTYHFKSIGESGDAGGFTLNAGTGTTILRLYGSGADASLYTGITTLQRGTLTVFGSLASTTINLTGGNLTTEGANGLADSSVITLSSANSTLTIGGSDTIASLSGSAGKVTFSGGTLTTGGTSSTSFSGTLEGSGNLIKQGSGTFTLGGTAANTYSGTTTVNAGVLLLQKTAGVNALAGTPTIASGGTLRLGASDQFNGDSTFVTVNSGGTFDINGFSDTVAIQGAGSVTLGSSGALTINPTSTDTFSGVISGAGRIIKANSGTQVLSGNNTYTGGTLVSGGVLRIGDNGTTGSVTGDITNNATVTFFRSDAITYGGVMSGTGSLQKWGAGTLTLSGANTVSGANHYLLHGTTLFTATQGAGFTGTLNLGNTSGADSATLAIGTAGVTVSNPIDVRSGSSGTMTIAAQNTTGTGTFSGTIAANRNVDLNAASEATLALSGNISGSSTIAKRGTGTAVLSGNNATGLKYDLYEGELQASSASNLGNNTGNFIGNKLYFDGGTLGATGTFTLAGNNGITLGGGGGGIRVAANQTLTLQGYINDGSSTGVTFTKSGAGTLFLDKADVNDLNGTTLVVSEGTLSTYNPSLLSSTVQLGGSATKGTFNFTKTDGAVTTGANFQMNAGGGAISVTDNDLTVSGTISGSGAMEKTGSGRLTLSGNNSNSGGVTLSAGQLRLSTTTAAGTGTITQTSGASTLEIDTTGTVANTMDFYKVSTLKTVTLSGNKTLNNATYDVASGTTTTESGALSGGGGITKEGAGTLIVSGSTGNTFTGASAVNAGTLRLEKTSGNAISGSSIAINGGTLLLGASNQIGDSTAINLAGGTFALGGNTDTVGRLTVSANSIFDFGTSGGSATNFTFSDFNTAAYGSNSWVMTINNAAVGSSITWNIDYRNDTTFNSFASKVQFGGGTGQFGQLQFGTGTTTLLVAIPDTRVYSAAAFLIVLIGVTEYRRRRRPCRR